MYFLPSFELVGVFVQDKKLKTDFQYGDLDGQLRFPFRTILAILDQQVTLNFLPSFKSVDLSVQEIKLFLIYKLSRYYLPSFESVGLSVREKFKIDFQDGRRRGHLGFPIWTILAVFDLQVTLIHCISYQVSSQSAFRFRRRSSK